MTVSMLIGNIHSLGHCDPTLTHRPHRKPYLPPSDIRSIFFEEKPPLFIQITRTTTASGVGGSMAHTEDASLAPGVDVFGGHGLFPGSVVAKVADIGGCGWVIAIAFVIAARVS